MALSHSPKIVTDGLVLCFDTADPKSYSGSGNTIYNRADSSTYPSMTLTGDTSNYGSIGNGYVTLGGSDNSDSSGVFLNGSGDLATTINNDFTTSGWMYRFSGYSNNSHEIMSYRNSYYRLCFAVNDSSMHFQQRRTVSPFDTNQTAASSTNSRDVWEHFTVVKNSSGMSFYKNGVLISTNSYTFTQTLGPVSGFTASYAIGWNNQDDDYRGRTLNGRIGPTHHYNRALTAPEVLQNYNATKGRFS